MKRTFEIIGLIGLLCASFFYTNKISSVIKENDDIMKQIEEIKEQYKKESIESKIDGNTIIPGLSGSEIDVKESYKKMKKTDAFNSNLLVYKDIKPSIGVKYDKYIISGNKNKKEISLIFLVDNNDNIDKILKILNTYEIEATFFIDGHWFENNNQIVIDLVEEGHIVGNLGYKGNYEETGVSWMNTIVSKIAKQDNTYCYVEEFNDNILNRCKLNNSYTIKHNLNAQKNPLISIKNGLSNGSIISLNITDETIKELPLIIEYINSKDLSLVDITRLLED